MRIEPFIAVVVSLSLASTSFAQQDKSKRKSPPAHASCALPSGGTVTIDYSSPRMNGRKIYGGLVPFGEVWRTGANEATTFTAPAALTLGGKDLPAGSYTLFTLPAQDKWTLIVSKKTGEWGIPYPGEANDFLRVEMAVSKLPGAVEGFTIGLDKNASGCTMKLDWETTRASIEISQKK